MDTLLNNYEIYLGTVAGSLIHLDVENKRDKYIHLRNDEKCEITALSWGRTNREILIGYKNGDTKTYDILLNKFSILPLKRENSTVVGIIPIENNIIIVTNSGKLSLWSGDDIQTYLTNDDKDKSIEKAVLNPYNQNTIGMGGYNNDIKLFDISTQKVVFQGKADRHDELNLVQPVSVNSITYFESGSGMDFGTVTRQGQIRIYDTRSQRRPIKVYKNSDSVYTSISTTTRGQEVVVGSNKGYLQVMDLRNQIKPVKTFKGFLGGVREVLCDTESPIVSSCSWDRHFRIHNLEENALMYQEYMKIQLTGLIMRKKHFVAPIVPSTDEIIEELEDVKRSLPQEIKISKKIKT